MPTLTSLIGCAGKARTCVGRITKLGPDCKPVIDTDGTPIDAVFGCIVNIAHEPNIDTKEPLELKSSCSDVCVELPDCDDEKRVDFTTFEIGVWDYNFLSIATGQPITTLADGTAIGWGRRLGKICPDGFALELWSKVATKKNECTDNVQQCYWHEIFPRITSVHIGGASRGENDFHTMTFSGGRGYANNNWGMGPLGIMPGGVPLPPDVAEYMNLWVDVNGVCLPLPAISCPQRP